MKRRERMTRTKHARVLFSPQYEVDLNGISVSATTYAKLKSMFRSHQTYQRFKPNE